MIAPSTTHALPSLDKYNDAPQSKHSPASVSAGPDPHS
jgi:hypothetical protein